MTFINVDLPTFVDPNNIITRPLFSFNIFFDSSISFFNNFIIFLISLIILSQVVSSINSSSKSIDTFNRERISSNFSEYFFIFLSKEPSKFFVAELRMVSVLDSIISIIDSASVKLIFPFIKARFVNSPFLASLAPFEIKSSIVLSTIIGLPWVLISIEFSPVKEFGLSYLVNKILSIILLFSSIIYDKCAFRDSYFLISLSSFNIFDAISKELFPEILKTAIADSPLTVRGAHIVSFK